MTAIPVPPGAERGSPYDDGLLGCKDWPVPQLGARVYELVALANQGWNVDQLALRYLINAYEVYLLCMHHRVGVKRGLRLGLPIARGYRAPAAPKKRPRSAWRSGVEASLPPEDP